MFSVGVLGEVALLNSQGQKKKKSLGEDVFPSDRIAQMTTETLLPTSSVPAMPQPHKESTDSVTSQ